MNVRGYVRVLRPLNAVAWTAFFSFGASRFCIALGHDSALVARWAAIGSIAPLLFGVCIATAANTVLHRPFSLLWPDAVRRLRWASIITLVFAALVTAVLAAAFTPVPFAGEFGLALALLALALALPPATAWVLSAGLPIIVLIGTASRLFAFISVAPWTCVMAGLAVSSAIVVRVFSRREARRRAFIPFNSAGVGFFALWNFSTTRRYAQELLRHQAQQSGNKPRTGGRDWSVRRVTGTTWSWMRVFWHAEGRRIAYPWTILLLAGFFAGEIAAFPLLGFLFANIKHDPFSAADYAHVLANLGARDPFAVSTHAGVGLAGMCIAAEGLFFAALSMLLTRPRLFLPLSRRQLSAVAFGIGLVQIGVTILALGVLMWLVSLTAQWASGRFLPGLGVYGHAVLILGLMPVLPLLTLTRAIRGSFGRLLLAIVMGSSAVAIALTRPSWQNHLLSPLGLCGQFAATAAAVWVMHAGLRWYYRRVDLIHDLRAANPLLASTGSC